MKFKTKMAIMMVVSSSLVVTGLYISVGSVIRINEIHALVFKKDYDACLATMDSKPTLKDMALCKQLSSGFSPTFYVEDKQ